MTPAEIGALYTTTATVRAVQLTPDADWEAIATWCRGTLIGRMTCHDDANGMEIVIPGGGLAAELGDWIIQGVTGYFFLRHPDVFAATYTPANQAASDGEVSPWAPS